MEKIIAVIPARGGSRRVKDKNIRDVNGAPLIAWTICDLKDAESVDEIYVSTDSIKIEDIAASYGAKIIERPSYLADDKTHIDEVVIHTLKQLKTYHKYVGIFQCTTPFRNPKDIDMAVLKIVNENADSLFFATPIHRFIWTREPKPLNYDILNRPRSQDKTWELAETGDYIVKQKSFLKYNNRLCGKITYFIGSRLSIFDVDTEEDLMMVRAIAKGLGLYATN